MQVQEIETRLRSAFADCEVTVSGEGNHYDILVVGDVFDGLRPVQRQQLVYAELHDLIADGSVHAVNIKTYTTAQWQSQQG